MAKEIHSCICMTCGVRNDHSTENGYCQNGHDNWLEYRDVYHKNEFFKKAMKIFDLSSQQLERSFVDKSVLQIPIKNLTLK